MPVRSTDYVSDRIYTVKIEVVVFDRPERESPLE